MSGVAAARLTGTVLFPGGDEPHYLVMAQSLWRDGDLKIENNHERLDYKEYFKPDLKPDYLTRGKDGEIYSIHPIGMPVLMAPVYAAGGYHGVVAAFVLLAAVAAGVMTLAIARATTVRRRGVRLGGGRAHGAVSVQLVRGLPGDSRGARRRPGVHARDRAARRIDDAVVDRRRDLCRGLAVAQHEVRADVRGAGRRGARTHRVAGRSEQRSRRPEQCARHASRARAGARDRRAVRRCRSSRWFGYFYWVWGTPWPQAPYGSLVQTNLLNLTFGGPGLFFDQEYGLLPYAPVFALAGTGLWRMWRDGGNERRTAIEITLVVHRHCSSPSARSASGGAAPPSPGRPIASGLWLFALPIAVAFRAAPADSARRAAQHLLLWLSIGIAAVMLFAERGFLIANGRDGTSSLLEYLSPRWPAWSAAPSFIYHEPLTALTDTAAWLLIAAAAVFALTRIKTTRAGIASLASLAVGFIAVTTAAALVPRLPATPAWPERRRARPRAHAAPRRLRSRGTARSASPTTRCASCLLPTSPRASSLEVRPGSRLEPQPIRVIAQRARVAAGGRLPSRRRLDRRPATARSSACRSAGPAMRGARGKSSRVPGEHWSTEFTLPFDAGFVGLRGTPELEKTIGRIAFVPVSVIDRGRRPRFPEILGASSVPGTDYFYFDENALPEARGFWIRGARTTRVLIQREHAAGTAEAAPEQRAHRQPPAHQHRGMDGHRVARAEAARDDRGAGRRSRARHAGALRRSRVRPAHDRSVVTAIRERWASGSR